MKKKCQLNHVIGLESSINNRYKMINNLQPILALNDLTQVACVNHLNSIPNHINGPHQKRASPSVTTCNNIGFA